MISYVFSSTKSEVKKAEEVLPGSRGGLRGSGEKVAQIMYTLVSKWKNDKIKGERRKM
jgi:hypothetical protein